MKAISLSRPLAFALVIAFWAAIYLPGLGSIEIKGEEIRRIMPGINMLESGDWIVPHFNGYPYLRKPPLVNWAIAVSVREFGARNEWTVRIPSVFAVLAMGLVMLATCSPWLGTETALGAVLITFVNAGMIEKGRLAEIEAIYIGLFGMAFSCWLGWTATGRSRWLVWPVTGFLLGLGLLAKGPPDLAFFYAIAAFIAWKSRGKSDDSSPSNSTKAGAAEMDTALLSWAHLCGIVVMLGVFALWCVPYMRHAATLGAGGVWARQMEQRLGGGSGGTVFVNFRNSLVNFLPWVLGLPLFWHKPTLARLDARDRLIIEASRWPIMVCAFGVMFIPGMLPRYTLPLLIPYALCLALLLRSWSRDVSLRWPLAAACIASAGMLVYAVFFGARVSAHGYARNFAAQVNDAKPAYSPIVIFNPSVQPEIFYIHGPLSFQESVKTLPDEVPYLLIPDKDAGGLRKRFRTSEVLAQPVDQGGRKYALLSLSGHVNQPKPPKKTASAPAKS